MLGRDNSVRRCKTVVVEYIQYQNLAIANRGPGGQLSVARPPGRVIGAPQAPQKITGSSDTQGKRI
jgi:hypothetical protein